MQYKISFSEEKDFREIVDKLDLYFEKEPGYFENLVPVLYKKGKNTFQNHIVVKDVNKIVGIIAVKKNTLSVNNEEYSFVLLGSLAVDFEYRNQGIMGMLFDFILDKYSNEVDFLGLSGKFDRYKRFGFFPSEKMFKYDYCKKSINDNYSFVRVNEENVAFCEELYKKEDFKVSRPEMIDNLYMWEYKPYIVKNDDKEIGYLIYNHKFNIIEEIILLDNSLLNDVIYAFINLINMNTSLKISMANRYLKEFISEEIPFEEYFERTLYKINNPKLKGIYVPRSDLI